MFFQPTTHESRPRFRHTRRSRRGRVIMAIIVAVVLGVVLSIAALIVFSSSRMTIASWRSVPALESVVGDHGTVSAYVREFNYSSGASCELTVHLADDITADETATVLQALSPSDRFAPCTISRVETETRSVVDAEEWDAISDDGWATVADYLTRPSQITLYLASDGTSKLFTPSPDTYSEFVTLVRDLTTGGDLDDTLSPVEWAVEWNTNYATRNSVRITTDERPPAALTDFLAAVTVPMQGASNLHRLTYTIADGEAHLTAVLREPDTQITATIEAAFAASGLQGDLTINLSDE